MDAAAIKPTIDALAYSPNQHTELGKDHKDVVGELPNLLEAWPVTWLNVDGVGDLELVQRIGELFGLHRLVMEDLVHVHQRSKAEPFEEVLFVVARMVRLEDEICSEQLGIVVGEGFVLTFQEGLPGDCLEPVRRQIRRDLGRIRVSGPDYLLYAILDAVVDHYFPVLERFADRLERLEDDVINNRSKEVISRVHRIQRQLLTLQRTIWPMRDLLKKLRPSVTSFVTPETELYLRDVSDHIDQLLDLIASYREIAKGLIDLRLSLASHRMNEVMHVLTVVGAIFLPLTFVTGLYGMNFDPSSPWNMPELKWTYGYEYALALMLLMTLFMLVWFRRKGWLRG